MAGAISSILVFVLAMAVLFGLLFISGSTKSVSANEPKIVHTVTNNSNLGSLCLGVENYESLFSSKGPLVGLPSYVPQGYSLQCINVGGSNPSEEDAITFLYFKDDQEFQSRFLPEIEKEIKVPPFYTEWASEFYDAGGILVHRSIEYIEEDDPRYNDKLKHVEIERAVSDPRNECSLPEFTRGNCELQHCSVDEVKQGLCDLQSEYPPIAFANGNPISSEISVQQTGKQVAGLLMYMDHNWLVYITGASDPDELFKIAETIRQIDTTEMNVVAPIENQTSKYAGLTQEQIILVKTPVKECNNKVAVVGMSDGEEAARQLQMICEEGEAMQISRFLSSAPLKERITVVNGTIDVGAGSYVLYPIGIPPDSTEVEFEGYYTSNGTGIVLDVFDRDRLNSWKKDEFAPTLEPLVGAGASLSLYAVAGHTVYLVIDNTFDHDHSKQVEAYLELTYVRYVPK